jgi:RNA polymerase sigma-70 factor, ECF subfamily
VSSSRQGVPRPPVAPAVARGDGELIRLVESGSTDAFAALYDRYSARAYRLARAICRDDGRAADAVHEAFASIWRRRAASRPDGDDPGSWLLGVVRHRATDVARRHGIHAGDGAGEKPVGPPATPSDDDAEAPARVEAGRLRALLAGLPPDQQEVIALAFYAELSHAEIAARLELPAGTVKGRMRVGLRRLRAEIGHVAA